MNEIDELVKILQDSRRLVFFGGAGVSTESGIPDFRSAQGLWNEKLKCQLRPEQLVSHTYYERFPEEFFEFYKAKLVYPQAKPNACHLALARLEQLGKRVDVVTQNIDGLHQQAGSTNVCELHGSVLRNYCEKCGEFYDAEYVLKAEGVPHCSKCGGRVKPDVVLYEEPLDMQVMQDAVDAIELADTMIIGGTSLVVYPAAGMVNNFHGENLVLINMTETRADRLAKLAIHKPIGQVMGEAVDRLEKMS